MKFWFLTSLAALAFVGAASGEAGGKSDSVNKGINSGSFKKQIIAAAKKGGGGGKGKDDGDKDNEAKSGKENKDDDDKEKSESKSGKENKDDDDKEKSESKSGKENKDDESSSKSYSTKSSKSSSGSSGGSSSGGSSSGGSTSSSGDDDDDDDDDTGDKKKKERTLDSADIKQDMCVTKSTKKDVRRFCKDEFAENCDPPPPQPALGTCEWYGLVPEPAWMDKKPEFDIDVSGRRYVIGKRNLRH